MMIDKTFFISVNLISSGPTLVILPSRDGVVIEVRVIPRASRPGPAGARDGALLLRLQAPPVDGAANAEAVHILADLLGVPRRAVTILSGHHSRRKRIAVTGLTVDAAARKLQVAARALTAREDS
jgi:uncharacterized protein (TIGR00251 family)